MKADKLLTSPLTLSSAIIHKLVNLSVGEISSIWRRSIRNFSISLFGSVALIAVGLGRTAILTKSLTLVDYGKVLIIINFFSFLGTFLSIRVNDVIYRFYPQFEEQKDIGALRALLLICFALNLGLGLIIGGGVYALAPWIASRFYQDPTLTLPFRVYAWGAALVLVFTGIYTPILRLHDRFACVVIPQVLGAIATVATISIYLHKVDTYHLAPIISAFVLGIIVQTIPPLISAVHLVRSYIPSKQFGAALKALRKYRRELISNLFHTNIVGYLKLGADAGGMFLLGILSTPGQVALYGIARQLTNPLITVQNNIQTAITPEITSLWARQHVKQLHSVIRRLFNFSLILGGATVICALLLARPVILLISKPQYLEALPIFYVLIISVYLTFVSLTFYPLALCMDQLKRRNVIVGTRLVFLGIAVMSGLNALKLSVAQLCGVLSLRLLFDIPLFRRLRRLSVHDLEITHIQKQSDGYDY